MARRRRRRRRTRGVGNIITTRKAATTSGLGKLGSLKKPGTILGSVLPPLLGGGLAAIATYGIQRMAANQMAGVGYGYLAQTDDPAANAAVDQAAANGDPGAGTASTANTLHKYAPVLGIALGSAGAFFLGSTFGKPAGWAAFAGAVGVGGAMWARQLLGHNTSGLGTIVPEYGTSGLGSIVMEPNSAQGYNAYSGGASVDIRGLGASGSGLAGGLGAGMDVSAFGPSSF